MRHDKPSLPGLFFLSFCTLGAPALLTSGSGCTRDAHAGQPTLPEEGTSADAKSKPGAGLWREGDAIPDPDYDPERSLAPMLDAVRPAVVSIQTSRDAGPFRSAGMGIGSGFILSAEGLVVTNNHVAESGKHFEVELADGRVFEASVVGSDPQTDLAVLRLSGGKDLPTVVLGSSDALRVGDWVIAVGSPMGLSQTVTRGILSAKGRGSLGLYRDGYADFLQTDAAINPGNSGGPLFNLEGEVIGINTAIGGHDGLGFAVPIDQAKAVLPRLIRDGKITRGWIGISGGVEAKPAYGQAPEPGAAIGEIHPDTPAAKAGLRSGDRVIEIDGEPVEDFEQLRAEIGEHAPKDRVALTVVREGKREVIDVELAERPDPDALERLSGLGGPKPSKPDASGDLYGGKPARLGVEIDADLKVVRVVPGGVGDRLGLAAGDVIREINGKSVDSVEAIVAALEADRSKLEVEVGRGEGSFTGSLSSP
ncbi:trypsin-like peptidase domain-containing protein [Nannocystaceae bacterium ST9]